VFMLQTNVKNKVSGFRISDGNNTVKNSISEVKISFSIKDILDIVEYGYLSKPVINNFFKIVLPEFLERLF